MLEAIANALQLDETERAHLFDLARAADGIPASARPRRRATKQSTARPSLQWALAAITDGVAFVRNQRQDLLGTNELGRAFYSPVIGDGGRTPNLARFQFLDPASRDFYPDWDLLADELLFSLIHLHGGPAPVRRFLPQHMDLIASGAIEPGKVFDLTLPLAEVAEGYAAMDERRAIKTLLTL